MDMKLYREHLLESGVFPEQIVFINLEDYDLRTLYEADALHAYVKERLAWQGRTYVFIDEVQYGAAFPRVLDSLYSKADVDIYVTGSNAFLLSGEIATLLSGRYIFL